MKQLLTNLINYFFPPSVSGVMASFQKTINDLHKVSEYHLDKASDLEDEIEDLLDDIDLAAYEKKEAEDEVDAALKLANKLSVSLGLTN